VKLAVMRLVVPLIFALLMASLGRATTMPALQASRVPEVSILDDASQPTSFGAFLGQAGSGPVILLPMFTRCSASCPILTHKLVTALAGMQGVEPYRVIVFSFDPLETDESLRLYRAQEHLPAEWRMVRARESEIREFFGFFRYTVMNQDGTLIHPNEIFLLDQALNWRWTLVGEDWTKEDLAVAIRQTRSPGLIATITSHPERLAWTGFTGAILGLCLAIGWMIRRKPTALAQV
jgi:cytochrome oxidase Cu insertion factor (SCO1/SenC/PrrC family)